MGLFSSSKSSSKYYQTTEIDNSQTLIDAGAIAAGENIAESAMDLSAKAIDAMTGSNQGALQAMQDMGNNALNIMASTVRDQDSVTIENLGKYLSWGLGAVAVALILRS